MLFPNKYKINGKRKVDDFFAVMWLHKTSALSSKIHPGNRLSLLGLNGLGFNPLKVAMVGSSPPGVTYR